MKARKTLKIITIILTCLMLSPGCSKKPVELYVSPQGSDTNPGIKEQPFATIERARDEVRKIIKEGLKSDINVFFREGIYKIQKTVVFGLEDGGNGKYKITYQAYPGEYPVFSSGLNIEGWEKISKYPSDLPKEAYGKVWVTGLPKELDLFKVMYDGEQLLPRARSEGFNSTRKEPSRDRIFLPDEEKQMIYFPKGVLKNWDNLEDVEIVAYPSVGWVMNILPLASVDERSLIAKTIIPGTYPIRYLKGRTPMRIPKGIWIENVLEVLDEPGEWVVNTQESKIYYWPEKGEPGNNVVVPLLQELLKVEGNIDKKGPADIPVQNIHFKGLTFMHGERDTWKKGDAGIQHDWEMVDKPTALLRFRGAENCSVEGCRFTSSGGTGLRLDLHCQNITITKNLFEHLGNMGVLLCGYGPGTKDVNKNNVISNNILTKCGQLYSHGHGITAFQSGNNLISHNTIFDMPRKAISLNGVRTKFFQNYVPTLRECAATIRKDEIDWEKFAGKDLITMYPDVLPYYHSKNNIIEYNYCENLLYEGADGAAINITAAGHGNIILHNFVQNLTNPLTSGIRLDGHVQRTRIYNNILVNAHGIKPKPPHNETYNNIVIFTKFQTEIPQVEDPIMFDGDVEGRIVRNVIYYTKDLVLPFDREKIKEKIKVKIDSNLYFSETMQEEAKSLLREFRELGYEEHGIFADPQFLDIKKNDFRLKENSPLIDLGFKEITIEGIGIKDDYPEHFKTSLQ